jgi:Na+-driven multidrug efflux pump
MDRERRSAVVVVVAGLVVGTVAILTMQAFREPLRDWLVDNPSQTAARATLLIAAAGAMLVIPLLAFAGYAWRLAAKDASRARGLKIISSISVIFAMLLAAILWRLSIVLTR